MLSSRLPDLPQQQEGFEPATLPAVPLDCQPQPPAGEPNPHGMERPSQLSADPVIAGMQIGNFIWDAVHGTRTPSHGK